MKLTPQQRAAVDFDGNLLLKACPGSGKTRTIVAKLVEEVERLRDTSFSVACITYTNAAVQEIEQRATSQLAPGDERVFLVSTIHSFCLLQVLRPFASRVPGFSGAAKVLTRDRVEFSEIADYAAAKVGRAGLTFSEYEAFGNLGIGAGGELIGSALENDMIKAAAPHFWERAAALGFIDFANIIYKSYCLLRDDAEIALSLSNKFRSFLIDEFQDTSEIQIELLKLIYAAGRSRFFLVGDPAQSIFGFAGARPELIDPFADHIAAKRDLSLSANFRSNPAIVRHAELLFPRSPAMTSEGKNKVCVEEPTFFWTTSTFNTIVEEFLPAIDSLGLPLGRCAILAKAWAPLFPIARMLRDYGTPIVGPGARPYRRSRLFAALAEQLCGAVIDGLTFNIRQVERATYHAIQDITGKSRLDLFGYEGRVTIMHLLRAAEELAETNGGAVAWLEAMSDKTGAILIANGWLGAGDAYVFRASVEEMKNDMLNAKVDIANLSIEDLGMFASPDRALRLTTIHNSKGHEYAGVAIIGVREGTIPFYRAKTVSEVEAERRQFYVGVTRAERLLMYIGEVDSFGNAPSRFLGPNGVQMIA